MNATPQTQRDLFESAVIERMKESGFLEVEIRVECLTRCDDGYNDPVINAGWHYWNAAIAADSGDEEQPRYTTRRLHDEIRKAEERGRQEERECTTSPSDYYKRAAVLLEKLRDEIGSGFGEGDIERIGDIVIARLRAWDKLDREDVKRRLSTPPAPSVAVKALHQAASDFMHLFIQDGHLTMRDLEDTDLIPAYEKLSAALSAQAQDDEDTKAAIDLGASVLSRIADPAARETAIKNALVVASNRSARVKDVAEGKELGRFELWFFQHLTDDQRTALFALNGYPTTGMDTHVNQRLALKHWFSRLPAAPAKQEA